jgi:hypothetical protein
MVTNLSTKVVLLRVVCRLRPPCWPGRGNRVSYSTYSGVAWRTKKMYGQSDCAKRSLSPSNSSEDAVFSE